MIPTTRQPEPVPSRRGCDIETRNIKKEVTRQETCSIRSPARGSRQFSSVFSLVLHSPPGQTLMLTQHISYARTVYVYVPQANQNPPLHPRLPPSSCL